MSPTARWLNKMLHTFVKAVVADHPEVEQFVKLDAEKSDAVTFHTISVPLPQDTDDNKNFVKLVGEKLDIVIGVGKQYVCLAAGRDAMETLKKAIDASGNPKAVPPLEISLAAKPVASTVATVGKPHERPVAAMIEADLKKAGGKDHVTLSARPIPNGVQVRLEVEQGLLRLAGRAAVMAMEGKKAPQAPASPE